MALPHFARHCCDLPASAGPCEIRCHYEASGCERFTDVVKGEERSFNDYGAPAEGWRSLSSWRRGRGRPSNAR